MVCSATRALQLLRQKHPPVACLQPCPIVRNRSVCPRPRWRGRRTHAACAHLLHWPGGLKPDQPSVWDAEAGRPKDPIRLLWTTIRRRSTCFMDQCTRDTKARASPLAPQLRARPQDARASDGLPAQGEGRDRCSTHVVASPGSLGSVLLLYSTRIRTSFVSTTSFAKRKRWKGRRVTISLPSATTARDIQPTRPGETRPRTSARTAT
jgi:hypothetical protein